MTNIKQTRSSFQLPKLGLGTWKIGGEREVDNTHDEKWVTLIKAAIALGYRHIDTAPSYGAGHAEELIGRAINSQDRKKLILATKVSASELAYQRCIDSAHQSLERLSVDYLDILYIHAPNPEVPLSETMRAMDDLVASGVTKHIAVSNFTVEQLQEAESYTNHEIVANQIEYNLRTREHSHYAECVHMESRILPYCQQKNIFIVASRPLDRGTILEPNPLMDEMVNKYQKTKAQIALNWLLSQANVAAIVKSSTIEHLEENYHATEWHLEPKDVEKLRIGYPSDRQ